jgi:hypothetical protein
VARQRGPGPHRAGRIGAAVLATYWLVTACLAAIHGGTDRHTYCPEHRTFEEQSEARASAKAVASEAGSVDRAPLAPHEVCPFGDCLNPPAGARPAVLRVAALVPARRAATPPVLPLPPPVVPLLLNAPKASPPLV